MVEMNNQVTNIGGYSYTERVVLGKGVTGEVILARAQDGRKVAMKILYANPDDPDYEKLHENMQNEVEKLKDLDHQHVMKFLGAGLD